MLQCCLGLREPKLDRRTFKLANYLAADLPPAPPATAWRQAVKKPWGVMGNDAIGNCGLAAPAHGLMGWTANARSLIVPTDGQVVSEYIAVTGAEGAAYDPGTGANDNGVALLDVLNRWRSVGLFGHKIGAFASIDDKADPTHTRLGIDLMGGLLLGLALPKAAQVYLNQGKPWLAPTNPADRRGSWAPRSWGGHAVWAIDYDDRWVYVVTWGMVYPMSWNFYRSYCDESYATVSADWIGAGGKAPSGFDAQALTADLQAL